MRPFLAHRHTTHVGKWELLESLGAGQWSTVYRARPQGCPADRPADYAVKVARDDGAQSRHAQALITREATVGRVVAHRHLIAILSAQVDTAPYFLVMPLLEGATLRAALDACGPLPTSQALWLVRQIAEALAALHQAGWMHADVKPDNIHVSPHGHATLIDLGFALRLDSPECTPGSTLRGTLKYTAPEMISGITAVDQHCDVYSLGVTLFEMLTGRPPFVEDDPGQLMLAHLQRPVPNARRLLPSLAREVNLLLHDMLAKEPLRRPSGAELVQRLVQLEIATLGERGADGLAFRSAAHALELIED